MKLFGITTLIGLTSSAPQNNNEAQDATPVQTPFWVKHADFVSDEYYGDLWHNTIALDEIPEAGINIHDICKATSNSGSAWCPQNQDQAMRVFSDLVVRHFMPNSSASGVLDETEVSNIPTSIMTGFRTKQYLTPAEIPEPIDNVDFVANRNSGGPNDVYMCPNFFQLRGL